MHKTKSIMRRVMSPDYEILNHVTIYILRRHVKVHMLCILIEVRTFFILFPLKYKFNKHYPNKKITGRHTNTLTHQCLVFICIIYFRLVSFTIFTCFYMLNVILFVFVFNKICASLSTFIITLHWKSINNTTH